MSTIIIKDVLERARSLVINQARYQVATSFIKENSIDPDAFYCKANEMSEDDTAAYLIGTALLNDDDLIALVEYIGVNALYTRQSWLDDVGEYISEHKACCYSLWHHINQLPTPS